MRDGERVRALMGSKRWKFLKTLSLFLNVVPGHLVAIEIDNGVGDLDAAGSGVITHACCRKNKIKYDGQDYKTKSLNFDQAV
jgi:hypothetical protein